MGREYDYMCVHVQYCGCEVEGGREGKRKRGCDIRRGEELGRDGRERPKLRRGEDYRIQGRITKDQ